jgi:hypothetical protein
VDTYASLFAEIAQWQSAGLTQPNVGGSIPPLRTSREIR